MFSIGWKKGEEEGSSDFFIVEGELTDPTLSRFGKADSPENARKSLEKWATTVGAQLHYEDDFHAHVT